MKASIISNSTVRRILVVLFWIAVWQCAYMLVNKEILIVSPFQVVFRCSELVQELNFWQSVVGTLFRILLGFFAALILGVGLAMLTSRFGAVYELVYPALNLIKATPVASFIILAMVMMRQNSVPVFCVFLMVLPLVWGNVHEGLKRTDAGLLEFAELYGFSRGERFRHIYAPSVKRFFLAAVQTGVGLAWKAGVAAEIICQPKLSIGAKLYGAKIYLETRDVFAWTLVVILLSMLIEYIFVRLIKGRNKAEGL